ncbi:GNAT family N-acetyltransferase [Tessaracoccus antarcticus]|nr:GNAT family N-acetyltransferase [Tessaracoccus antarcticus]
MSEESSGEGKGSNEILGDGTVRLRPLRPGDLTAHANGCDSVVNQWTNGGRVSTVEEHLAWLNRNARAWRDGGPVVDLAIELCDTGEHVGVVGVQRGLPYLDPGEVNLTYALYGGQRGRGFATAAVSLAMRLAVDQEPVTAFLIRCSPVNSSSAAVARRLGFSYVGCVVEGSEPLDRYVLSAAALPRG